MNHIQELLNKSNLNGECRFMYKAKSKTLLGNGYTAEKIQSYHWVCQWVMAKSAESVFLEIMATGEYSQCKIFDSSGTNLLYPIPIHEDLEEIPF